LIGFIKISGLFCYPFSTPFSEKGIFANKNKKMLKRLISFLFIFTLCFSVKVSGQNALKFEHITVNEGLAHSDAMAVLRDHNGFVWIGTNKGIDRYDGYEIKNYSLPNRNINGQYTNRILNLHSGKNKRFWVVPEAQGVYYFDEETDGFKSLAEKSTNQKNTDLLNSLTARSICETPNGDLIIGTSLHGVFCVTFNKKGAIEKIQNLSLTAGNANTLVFSIMAEKNGKIWIGTVGNGLWTMEKSGDSYFAKPFKEFPDKIIRGIIQDRESTIWVASESSIVKISKASGQYNLNYIDRKFPNITTLFEDTYRRVWVGTRNGLFLIDPTSDKAAPHIEHFIPDSKDPASINYHLIHQITQDNFNNLWIAASAGGLNKVNLVPKPFFNLQKEVGGLPNDYTNSICMDKDEDVVWIGTRNGFSRFEINTKKITSFLEVKNLQTTPNVDVSSLYDDGNGTLWITTRTHGIYLLNKKSFALKKLGETPGQKEWKYAEPISVCSDANGLIWVACFYDGIRVFDKAGNFKYSFTKENSVLSSAKLTFLLEDKEKNAIWLSTRDVGVLRLKLINDKLVLDKQFSFKPDGLKTNYIWQLTKARDGGIWVGTIGGGLNKILKDDKTVQRFDKWLPETDVESILEDSKGMLWVGGNGIFKFNPQQKTYLHFDVADGLQSNSFKVASAAKDRSGNLYFGGINGVTYFNPLKVTTNPHPPVMQITQVRKLTYALSPDGKTVPGSVIAGPFSDKSEIRIKDSENDFSVEFVGLNFINPGKQHYEYKLDGYHENWVQLPQGQRMMTFSGLPAGKYTFRVKADNGDGVWTETPAALRFVILPPWYKTWWAYTFYALLIAAAIYWYKTTRNRQRELKNKIALEQMEKVKQQELADLKMNFFTNVSHELRTPLTLIMSPSADLIREVEPNSEAKQKAELVHKQAGKLLDLVNQLMDFRKVESGNMTLNLQTANIIPFINEIFFIFRIKAEEKGINYTINTPDSSIVMNFDPEKLEIVLTNLLSNAFKYTESGGSVEVDVRTIGSLNQLAISSNGKLQTNYLRINIKDTGSGIHEDELPQIFEPFYQALKSRNKKVVGTGIGLSLVKEFITKHKGEVDVSSAVNEGSLFSIKLPFERIETQYSEIVDRASESVDSPAVFVPNNLTFESKILIVEDNNDLREYLVSLFQHHFETHAAANGKEGLQLLSQIMPDVILSDVMMPELNGLELCEKVKTNPKTAHIPVILLTARATAVNELEGLESGADDYIVKPFNPQLLLTKVQSVIENRKKAQEYFHKQILVEPSKAVIPDADKTFIENTMKIIEDNLTNEQFSVQSLVRDSGMSQSAFYRKLKVLTGQSVIEFIKDVRLKRAAQLLSTKQYRVSEVAFMVGMEDLKNFRNSFQKLYGVPPSEYGKK
jgi:signal transduction histidine kinase/DNA-binding response OmpR family regulator/sugar lactone lactonase YvrE